MLITVWRCPVFIPLWWNAKTNERRMICLYQFCGWLVDVPFACMALIVTATPWGRGILLWRAFLQISEKGQTTDNNKKKKKTKVGKDAKSKEEQRDEMIKKQRALCWWQFLCALLDIPAAICAVSIVLTLWHFLPFKRELKTLPSFAGTKPHRIAFYYFFNLLIDLPFILFTFVIILSAYRLPTLVRDWKRQDATSNLANRRWLCSEQFFCVLLDLPCLLLFVLLFLLRWNFACLYTQLKTCGKRNAHVEDALQKRHQIGLEVHLSILYRSFQLVLHLPILSMVFITTITFWRLSALWKALRIAEHRAIQERYSSPSSPSSTSFYRHSDLSLEEDILKRKVRCVLATFFCLLLDVPASIALSLIFITRWHYPTLMSALSHSSSLSPYRRNTLILNIFFRRWIKDLPYFTCIVLVTLSIYRAPFLWRLLSSASRKAKQQKEEDEALTLSKKRKVVIESFLLMLCDIPSWTCYSILWLTRWRWTVLQDDLSSLSSSSSSSSSSASTEALQRYGVIFYHIGRLLKEDSLALLCIAFVTLFPHRLYILGNKLNKTQGLKQKRHTTYEQLFCVLLDPFILLCLLCTFITVLRVRSLRSSLQRLNDWKGLKFHMSVIQVFVKLLVDLPFVLCALLVTVTFWKVPTMRRRIKEIEQRYRELFSTITEEKERRKLHMAKKKEMGLVVLECAACVVVDVITAPCLGCVRLTWHWPYLKMEAEEKKLKLLSWDVAVLKHFVTSLLDVPYFICLTLLLVTVWRAKSVLSALSKAETLSLKRQEVLRQTGYLLLDIPAGIAAFVVIVTAWHAPSLLRKLKEKQGWEKHSLIFRHLLALLIDIPFILCTLFAALFFWRIPTLYSQFSQCKSNRDKRKVATVQARLALLDIPAFILGFVVFLTLWKALKLLRSIHQIRTASSSSSSSNETDKKKLEKQQTTLKQSRKKSKRGSQQKEEPENSAITSFCEGSAIHRAIFRQFILLLLDLPLLVFAVGVTLCPWRGLFLHRLLRVMDGYWRRRRALIKQFALLFLDVPAFVCFVLLLCSWRGPSTCALLVRTFRKEKSRQTKQRREAEAAIDQVDDKDEDDKIKEKKKMDKESRLEAILSLALHEVIFKEFIELVVDWFYVLLAILLLWRLPFLVRRFIVQKADITCAEQRRKLVWHQLAETIQDIPYLPLFLLSLVAVWRWRGLYTKWRQVSDSDSAKRALLWATSTLIVKDIAALLLVVVLCVIGPWRIPVLLRQLWRRRAGQEKLEAHSVLFHQLKESVPDLPYVPLFCYVCTLGFWRVPIMYSQFKKCTSDAAVRAMIRRNFVLAVQDVCCFIMVVIMSITLWRIPTLRKLYQTYQLQRQVPQQQQQQPLKVRKSIALIFKEWLYDLPFVPMFLVLLPCAWRSPSAIREMRAERSEGRARLTIYYHLIMLAVDVTAFLAAMAVAITLWRAPTLYFKLKSSRLLITSDITAWHEVTFFQFALLFVDIAQLLQMLFIFLTVTQVYSFVSRSRGMLRIYIKDKKRFSFRTESKKLWNNIQQQRRLRRRKKQTSTENEGEEHEAISLADIPEEILLEIFSYFSAVELTQKVSLVCGQFQRLAEDRALWKRLLLTDSRWTVSKRQRRRNKMMEQGWKELYQHCYTNWKTKALFSLQVVAGGPEKDYADGYRFVIHQEFCRSCKNLPHTIILPMKLLGYLIRMPALWWIRFRSQYLSTYAFWFSSCFTHNQILSQLQWRDNFWCMHELGVVLASALLSWIINDLMLLANTPAILLRFVGCLGYPLWNNPMQIVPVLAPPTLRQKWLKRIVILLNGLLLPVFLSYSLALVFLSPFIAFTCFDVALLSPSLDSSYLFWRHLPDFSSPFALETWKQLLYFPVSPYTASSPTMQDHLFWVLLFHWLVPVVTLHFTWTLQLNLEGRIYVTLPDCFALYVIIGRFLFRQLQTAQRVTYMAFVVTTRMLRTAFTFIWSKFVACSRFLLQSLLSALNFILQSLKRVLGMNNRFLSTLTRWCYKSGTVGNLLLTAVVPCWMFWPLLIPLFFSSYALWIPAFLLSVQLLRTGYKIVDRNWGDKSKFTSRKPVVRIESMTMILGAVEEHGIVVRVKGTKPADLEIKEIRLYFGEKQFWNTLKKAIGPSLVRTFRLMLYPLNISSYMTPKSFPKNTTRFDLEVAFGTEGRIHISKATLIKKLKEFKNLGDPKVEMRLEYGESSFGWNSEGVLFIIETSASDILHRAKTGTSFYPVGQDDEEREENGAKEEQRKGKQTTAKKMTNKTSASEVRRRKMEDEDTELARRLQAQFDAET
ncbi:hypothetical protein QOT17_022324 [Balamuthia mandrillaris]